MHEVNKMFIDMCLEELVEIGKLNKSRAKEIYNYCLKNYKK
jgi:hypothetical protein